MTGPVRQFHHVNTLNAPVPGTSVPSLPIPGPPPSWEDLTRGHRLLETRQLRWATTGFIGPDPADESLTEPFAEAMGVIQYPGPLTFAKLRAYYRLTVYSNTPQSLGSLMAEEEVRRTPWIPPWLIAMQEDMALHDPLGPADRADFDAIGAYGEYLAVHGIPR